jgi:hypothetical protein
MSCKKILTFAPLVGLLVGGCREKPVTIQQQLLPALNPTAIAFPYSLDVVTAAIERASESNFGFRYAQTLPSGSYSTKISAKRKGNENTNLAYPLLFQPGNENDFWLTSHSDPICLSQLYSKGKAQLPYLANFHVHIESLDSNWTAVRVTALETYVRYGIKSHGPHNFQPANLDAAVPATTIEEYRILQAIGRELGVTNMSAISQPSQRTISLVVKAEL